MTWTRRKFGCFAGAGCLAALGKRVARGQAHARVVVVGGGFGGLQAALALRRTAGVELTLVDRRNFHLFQPLTYQVATGALSPGEIAGVLNLRGRIVTVVDMRARLGLPKSSDGKPPMAVGVDLRGESYGLLIDQIGEVLRLPDDGREENPVNLDPRMAKLAGGVHRLDGQLMVVLDVDRVLEITPDMMAA